MRFLKQMAPLLAAVVVLQLVFRFGVPGLWDPVPTFWTWDNQVDLAEQISINAILAVGMMLTILIGGIDLSVGAVQALVGTTTVYLLTFGGSPPETPGRVLLAVLGGLAVGAAFGLFHGVCAAKTKMPPFIITLATMEIARGLAYRFNRGEPLAVPEEYELFHAIGSGRVMGLPLPVIIMLAVFAAAAVLLHRTRFGQHLYAMGGNREAARFTGVRLARNEIAVYTLCSLLAGVAGVISASQLYSANPDSGRGFELNAIAAAVVGGTSFTGGIGTMGGTLIGAVIIGIVNKGLNMAGVHFSYQHVVKGLVILGAVWLDVRRRK